MSNVQIDQVPGKDRTLITVDGETICLDKVLFKDDPSPLDVIFGNRCQRLCEDGSVDGPDFADNVELRVSKVVDGAYIPMQAEDFTHAFQRKFQPALEQCQKQAVDNWGDRMEMRFSYAYTHVPVQADRVHHRKMNKIAD